MSNKLSLYDFEISHQYLDTIGIKRLNNYGNNVTLDSEVDLTEEAQKGNIEWRKDGVYHFDSSGNWQKGYMYNKIYLIDKFGNPKFHLFKCETILDFINSGKFDHYYFWANTNLVNVTNRKTNQIYENIKLGLCSKCSELLSEKNLEIFRDTEEFSKSLGKLFTNDPAKPTNIEGYPFNWIYISRIYKREHGYECTKCQFNSNDFKMASDERYINVDHVNGDKTNNTRENLQCMDVLCHYYKHKDADEKFNNRSMQIELKRFVEKYRDVLEKKNKELLNRYDREFKN